MEKTVFNPLNVHTRKVEPRFISDEGMTQPNQSMTIKELLEKHARGLLAPANQPIYEPDIDYNHLNRLDIEERRQLEKQVYAEFEADKKRSEAYTKAKTEKARQDAINAEVEKRLKEKTAPPTGDLA